MEDKIMSEDRRGRPERQLDEDAIRQVFDEEEFVSTRELKNKYLDLTDEDGLGWNTLNNWLQEQDGFEVAKQRENVTIWRCKN